MNQAIQTDPRSKYICAPLFVNQDEPIVVEQFKSEGNLHLYEATYSVKPGNGKFKGYFGHEGNVSDIKILSERLARLNAYENTAFCAKRSAFQPYCYCLSLLKTSISAK
uniref:EAL domain-containing protein n=1 Tax=Panagrellus redivivus TaxID=6233 RepID=A0A7E4ZUS2_PANRE